MRSKLFLITGLLLATLFLYGCTSESSPSENGGSVNQPIQTGKDFRAAATAEGSVLLDWEPVNGAEQYLVELQIGGDEFIPLGLFSADITSFEDVNLPPDTEFTYRLTVLSGGSQGKSQMIAVTTPAVPAAPIQVTLEFDQTPAAFDTSQFSAEGFDPSSIDPSFYENLFPTDESGEPITDGPGAFDPSMFMPQPVESYAVIGSAGGDVSVTGSNGVVYTLSIPPNALRMEVPITLLPISNIPDLPLSGGVGAAIFIEPEYLVFDVPATLTMTPPSGSSNLTTSPSDIVTGFAFESEGKEFHLYPRLLESPQASVNLRMAKPAAIAQQAGPLAEIARLQLEKAGGFGVGSGSAQEIKKVSKKQSLKSRNRTASQAAVAQIEELTPLLPIEELTPLSNLPPEAYSLARMGEAILQKANRSNDWGKFMETLEDFRVYMNSGGDKYNEGLNAKILEKLLQKAKALLDKNKGECLTPDDFKAQDLVERLSNPKDKFSKLLSGLFKEKYGQKLLDDLAYGMKTCRFELDLKSALTFDSGGSTMHVSNEFQKLPLQLSYLDGEIYLWGSSKMIFETRVTGPCPVTIKQYDSLYFVVEKLTPVFEGQRLSDLVMERYRVQGWKQMKSGSGKGGECGKVLQLQGGGDFWTGLFSIARISLDSMSLTGWEVKGNSANNGGALTARWTSVNPSFRPYNEDAKMSDDSKFTFRAIPYNRSK